MVSVCATCKGLQHPLRAFDGPVHHHQPGPLQWVSTTLPSLRCSTNAGCRACGLLLQGILLHHDRFAGVREDTIRLTAESYPPGPALVAQLHLSVHVRWRERGEDEDMEHDGDDPGYPDLKLEFYTDQDGQTPFSAIGRGRQLSESPLQEPGLSAARNMVKHCLSSHPRCRTTAPTTLPKRVLDVWPNDGTQGIKLHESALNETGEYLTLSHCWGRGKGILQTTTKTLQTHQRSIAWSTIPRTYQEAVALTRSLGFRWLWIDSLCVLQDDPSEKLEQSFNVSEIFSNAFLTVAATSAKDSNAGVFPPKTAPFKVQATDSKGSLFKIYVREQPSHYSFKAPFDEASHMNDWELPFNTSEESNVHTPLLKRAWAYAERLSAARVLHFTKSEMFLECREGYQCECGRIDNSLFDSRPTDSVKQEFARVLLDGRVDEMDTDRRSDGNGDNNSKRMDSVTSQFAAASLAEVDQDLTRRRGDALQLWSYIITEYTARDLTYDTDRLVAIAGIARAFFGIIQSGYIAGQWTYSTISLLWYPNDGVDGRRPSSNPGTNIPSWSWASLEGSPIFFDNAVAMDLACRASFPREQDGNSTWSPVGGSALGLTASMAAECTFKVDATNEYSLLRNGVSVDFRPDVIPPRGEDSVQAGETLVCVLVSMTFRTSIIGLVLKQSITNAQVYRRVGRFECYECHREGQEETEDAEALFSHWFPEVEDMTKLDAGPQRTFVVI